MARRIRGCFDHPFRIGELKVSVDCALGCAIRNPRPTPMSPTRSATRKIALKRAKQTDRIEIYEPEAALLADNRFGLETELRNAVEEDRLHLDFQPLVELSTGKVAGFEALARWNNSASRVLDDEQVELIVRSANGRSPRRPKRSPRGTRE